MRKNTQAQKKKRPNQKTNKDPHRIVIDPMLMIIYNLRLFLTAVTLTAVAPTAVWEFKKNKFGPYYNNLDHFCNIFNFF